MHRGAFCQFLFRWIYYCHISKSTGKETGKTHFCALYRVLSYYYNKYIFSEYIMSFLCVTGIGLLTRSFSAFENLVKKSKGFQSKSPGSEWQILQAEKFEDCLKVSKFQNKIMKSSFNPKYEPKIVRISALHTTYRAEILTIFGSYFGRNDDFII